MSELECRKAHGNGEIRETGGIIVSISGNDVKHSEKCRQTLRQLFSSYVGNVPCV